MAAPVSAAPHTLLGSTRRLYIALALVIVAVAAAVITTVLLLQSGTTVAPASVLDDGRPSVSDSDGDWLTGYRFGSADSLERKIG